MIPHDILIYDIGAVFCLLQNIKSKECCLCNTIKAFKINFTYLQYSSHVAFLPLKGLHKTTITCYIKKNKKTRRIPYVFFYSGENGMNIIKHGILILNGIVPVWSEILFFLNSFLYKYKHPKILRQTLFGIVSCCARFCFLCLHL